MTSAELGFALRPTVFSPEETIAAADLLDGDKNVSRIFIPEGRTGYESLEVTSSILGRTERISAGNGVIRILEHDPAPLARRIQTIQAYSDNRFFLGVGTGTPGPQPGKTVEEMFQRIEALKHEFQSFPPGVNPPEILVATLKQGIAKRSVGRADGILLNFCSPDYAAGLIRSLGPQHVKPRKLACYLKVFYSSRNMELAQRLMLQEFLNYDSTPQYHEMFSLDGIANAIHSLKSHTDWKTGTVRVPEELLKVSLVNPVPQQLSEYVESFRKSGITHPVIYPYFPNDEDSAFKVETVRGILKSI